MPYLDEILLGTIKVKIAVQLQSQSIYTLLNCSDFSRLKKKRKKEYFIDVYVVGQKFVATSDSWNLCCLRMTTESVNSTISLDWYFTQVLLPSILSATFPIHLYNYKIIISESVFF